MHLFHTFSPTSSQRHRIPQLGLQLGDGSSPRPVPPSPDSTAGEPATVRIPPRLRPRCIAVTRQRQGPMNAGALTRMNLFDFSESPRGRRMAATPDGEVGLAGRMSSTCPGPAGLTQQGSIGGGARGMWPPRSRFTRERRSRVAARVRCWSTTRPTPIAGHQQAGCGQPPLQRYPGDALDPGLHKLYLHGFASATYGAEAVTDSATNNVAGRADSRRHPIGVTVIYPDAILPPTAPLVRGSGLRTSCQ
jgi:hypothetical protein